MAETDLSDTALLIVDLQNDFLHADGAYARGGQTSASISALPCLLYTSPSPRDATLSRMPSSA